jgi:hypothetical protein
METNHSKSRDMKELKARKMELKQEMEQIQGEIESSLREVRHSVADRTRLRYWVDKYPLHLVGSALLAGFLLAKRGGARSLDIRTEETATVVREPSRNSFSSLLADELKKMVTQRAVRYVMQRVEEAIDERSKKEE